MRTASTLLLTICSWPLLLAQEADTSFSIIQQEYLKSTDSQPLEGVNASWKALDMEDTIPQTLYTGVSDENGIVQDSVPVCIDSTVGLAEQYKDAVKVGPVPGNELNIQLPQELAGKHQLNLYDMSGRQVKTEAFTGAQEHVSLQDLARGAYIYELLRDGEQVLSGKTVKVDVPVQGMQTYQPKSLAKNGQQKDLGDCETTYRIHWNAPDGWVNDSLDVTVSNTEENNYEILLQPWDTAYASGNIITFDAESFPNTANFVDLTIELESMEQVIVPTQITAQSNQSGLAQYEQLPVSVDTTGTNAESSANYNVSWPFTPRVNLDSTSLDEPYIGWVAGEETITVEPGTNSNIGVSLNRVPMPEVYAKRYLEGYLGKLKDGSPGSVNTPAEDAIVVIEHDEGIDTANVDMNGYWVSPQAYDHQEELFIGSGYPGGEHDGVNYGAYTNIDYIVEGSNLQDIASGDTTKIYKMNLMPKTAWSGKINENVDMTMSQFKEMYEVPQYHNAMFDTVAFYIDTVSNFGMGTNQINRIRDVAEDMTNWTPLTYVEMNEPIENESPYTIENATSTSHGSNVINGTNNITNIQQGGVISGIQGTSLFYLSAQVNVSGQLTSIYKELGFQRNAAMDVASRQSVMNSPANLPTNLDVAIMSQKHHFDKEMFNSTSTVNLPFDYNNQTQNVGRPYLSDSTNITPQQ